MAIEHDELLDYHEVAESHALSSHRAVYTSRARYDDSPEPLIEMGAGRRL